MIYSFDLFKRLKKILSTFLAVAKILSFVWKSIFRHLGTKWCSFVFLSLEICQGHMTVPGYGVVNLNTVCSAQFILLTLRNLLGCLTRSTLWKLETKMQKGWGMWGRRAIKVSSASHCGKFSLIHMVSPYLQYRQSDPSGKWELP